MLRGLSPRGAFDARKGGVLIGWAFRQLVGWLAVVVVVGFAVSHRAMLMPAPAPARAPAVAAEARRAPVANSLVFHAERSGHVVLEAAVNGAPVRMVVDTGATLVTLSKADAATAGIGGALNYSRTLQTANGRARAAPVTLRELRIGQLEIDDVEAVVVENLNVSLLGQSFLNRLASYEMRDGALTMNW